MANLIPVSFSLDSDSIAIVEAFKEPGETNRSLAARRALRLAGRMAGILAEQEKRRADVKDAAR